jgi:hypothetical protein
MQFRHVLPRPYIGAYRGIPIIPAARFLALLELAI